MKNSSFAKRCNSSLVRKATDRRQRCIAVAAMLLLCGCMADTENPQVLFERGNLKADRELYEDAIPLYSQALKAMPDRADILFERGLCYENLGIDKKALEDYSACLEIDPQFSDALNNKGVILARTKRFEDAAKVFTELVVQFPDDALALRNRGLCYSDLGRFDDALADYNLALKQSPRDVETWFQRGNVFLEQDKFELAIADYSKAIEVDGGFARAWMNRGVAKFGLDDRKGGMQDLEHAHSLNDSIVIPDLDWGVSDTEVLTTVIAAKPVIASGWQRVRDVAIDELRKHGFSEIGEDIELADQFCARLTAVDSKGEAAVYVGCSDREGRTITLPNVEGDQSRRVLIVLATTGEQVSVVAVNLEWDGNLPSASPVSVRVPLESLTLK